MPILFRQKPKFGPVLITAALFATTCALGAWQVKRMEWKNDLIQTVESRLSQAPTMLPADGVRPRDWAYRQVVLSGRFLFDKKSYVQALSSDGRLGYRVMTPLLRPGGTTVLVEREWIPFEALSEESRAPVGNEVELYGTLRYPQKPGWVARTVMPAPDADERVFYRRDLDGIGEVLGLDLEPFFIQVVTVKGKAGPAAAPFQIEDVPNNHLVYAITWFALALSSIAIFVLYHRRKEET